MTDVDRHAYSVLSVAVRERVGLTTGDAGERGRIAMARG